MGPVVEIGGAAVYTGTCSWTDPTLVKGTDWYPSTTMSAADRLAFYAAAFPIVEADSTYYFPPSPELARSWAERTPDGFRMNVKAYSLLTGHPTRPASLWKDMRDAVRPEFRDKRHLYAEHLEDGALDEAWDRFLHALEPLERAGKLGAVLFQFPEWFTPKRANRDELVAIARRLHGIPACVELRSPRWFTEDEVDRTTGLLRDLGLALVIVDAPERSKLPIVNVATADLAVVRFHGRNDDTWKKAGISAAERFKYLYNEKELEEWVPRVAELAEDATEVHVLMNNCYQDYGVRNAADMQQLLSDISES